MKGYWVALYKKIDSSDNLQKYGAIVTPIIKSFGGKALVRGGEYKCFEGDDFLRTVIWEFPSYDRAIDCYNSKEYQEGWSFAKGTIDRHLQIVKGFSTE